MRALQANSFQRVQAALDADPEAVLFPFWEHNVEPPLCCAVRLLCDAPIVELLLERGALLDAANVDGKMPLEVLRSSCTRFAGRFTGTLPEAAVESRKRSEVEALLIGAGADPLAASDGSSFVPPRALQHFDTWPWRGDFPESVLDESLGAFGMLLEADFVWDPKIFEIGCRD